MSGAMASYNSIECLQNIYLEDSFVRSLQYDGESIIFALEMVLNKDHELYFEPKPNELYCYVEAKLYFSQLRKVDWKKLSLQGNIDANSEVDFGNIDTFHFANDCFRLSGDWGMVEFEADQLKLDIVK